MLKIFICAPFARVKLSSAHADGISSTEAIRQPSAHSNRTLRLFLNRLFTRQSAEKKRHAKYNAVKIAVPAMK